MGDMLEGLSTVEKTVEGVHATSSRSEIFLFFAFNGVKPCLSLMCARQLVLELLKRILKIELLYRLSNLKEIEEEVTLSPIYRPLLAWTS